jgi:hypothetical protein
MAELTQEIIENVLKQIESSGIGKFTSYDVHKEVELINKRESKLSSSQRKKVLYFHSELTKGK